MAARNDTERTHEAGNGVPQPCLGQPAIALAKANAFRSARAYDKRRLSSGQIRFCELDLAADYLRNMKVLELLAALPWQTRPRRRPSSKPGAKAKRIMLMMNLPHSAAFKDLTPERKDELRQMVASRCPTQREAVLPSGETDG